jgi:predicted MFS family arabinose efflux permease
MTHPPVSPADRRAVIASAVLLTSVVAATLLIAPIVVGALITRYAFTPSQAGLTIAIELGAMSLAALPALWWLPRWSWSRLLVGALLVMIVGNVACAFATTFATLAGLRFITGFAGGSVMVVCLAVIGMTSQTERNFGWWTIGQLMLGAIGLALLPRVLPAIGLPGLYFGLAALLCACLVASRILPRQGPPAGASARGQRMLAPALLGLGGILCLYIALGGLWTYVERVGAAAGLAPALIGDDLTIASVCGIAGCLGAILLGSRFGRLRPLLLGFALIIGGAAALRGTPSPLRYLLAAGTFKFAWTFALPFILAGMASHDRSGRLMALANFMIGGGLALGPTIVAAALGNPPDYSIAPGISIAMGAISLALLVASSNYPLRARRPAPGS